MSNEPMTQPDPRDVDALVERLESCAEDYWGELACEAATTITALQAEVARLEALAARFDAPGGNLFTYVAGLEAKLAALGQQP